MNPGLYGSLLVLGAGLLSWLLRQLLYRLMKTERRTHFMDDNHKANSQIAGFCLLIIFIIGWILTDIFNRLIFLLISVGIILIVSVVMAVYQVSIEKKYEPDTNNYKHSISMFGINIVLTIIVIFLLFEIYM